MTAALDTPLATPLATPEIDDFIDALWLEDGLSKNTLAAYRRDLALFAQWLHAQGGRALDAARESDLQAYMGARRRAPGRPGHGATARTARDRADKPPACSSTGRPRASCLLYTSPSPRD